MLVLLIILIFIYHFAAAFYYAQGLEVPLGFEFLYNAAFLSGFVWWLRDDTRRSGVTPLYCQGLLVGIGWFIIIPYHLLKTRGSKGLLPLCALLGSLVSSRLLAGIIHFAFTFEF